jgi:hypothetical protein
MNSRTQTRTTPTFRERRPATALLSGAAWLLAAAIGFATPAAALEKQFDPGVGERMPVGEGAFEVGGVSRGPVTVNTYRPASATSNSPIWIVMPGARRNAHRNLAFDYYDTWRPLAEQYGAVLLVPEFTAEKWPGAWTYNVGNVRSKQLQRKPWRQTAFYVVEKAFRMAAGSLGSHRRKFSMFGHGAGAQFIQRYVLHSGCRMIDRAVAANAGWYLMPERRFRFPFGLGGAPIGAETLRHAFDCDLTLLLGTADTNYARLRNDPDARAQGKTRYARGLFYFDRSQSVAARLGARFGWDLQKVPGVGHESKRMAPAGAAVLAGRPVPGT